MDNRSPANGPDETKGGAPAHGTQRSVEQQDREVLAELHRRSRRGFLIGGAAAIAGFGLWRWFQNQPQLNGISAPLRKALEVNGRLSRKFFRSGALAPEFDGSKAVADFRLNGDIGLSDINLEDWRLELIGVSNPQSYSQYSADVMSWTYGMEEDTAAHPTLKYEAQKPATHEEDAKGSAVKMKPMGMPAEMPKGTPGLLLTMAEIRNLPKVEMVTEFKCIEGWSEIVHWSGARLQDFLAAYPPPTKTGAPFSAQDRPHDIPQYVGFETPDGEYYVGIEREAALHPQTLLAYEINDRPLTPDHGAPLRLVTPLKYGIKQLKQIGKITYSDSRPRDYWYEQGYDYYAGH
jgi:Oxidoreductase molybdopterin binding domain